jgi:hypothetical protein
MTLDPRRKLSGYPNVRLGTSKSAYIQNFSIVAFHGLASNPVTTWQQRLPQDAIEGGMVEPNWLRDFLPEEGLEARIMTYNHDTNYASNASSRSLEDHGNDFLDRLRMRRTKEQVCYFINSPG